MSLAIKRFAEHAVAVGKSLRSLYLNAITHSPEQRKRIAKKDVRITQVSKNRPSLGPQKLLAIASRMDQSDRVNALKKAKCSPAEHSNSTDQ